MVSVSICDPWSTGEWQIFLKMNGYWESYAVRESPLPLRTSLAFYSNKRQTQPLSSDFFFFFVSLTFNTDNWKGSFTASIYNFRPRCLRGKEHNNNHLGFSLCPMIEFSFACFFLLIDLMVNFNNELGCFIWQFLN